MRPTTWHTRLAPKGTHFVAKVAKTFGILPFNAETLGEFRYVRIGEVSAIGLQPEVPL